jgi:subtilisin
MSKNFYNEGKGNAVGRRAFVKAAGVTMTSVAGIAAGGTATASDSGYGAGGYGEGGFGGAGEGTSGGAAPMVDHLSTNESSPPNPHAELTVDWAASDADSDLETVDIAVFDGTQAVLSETVSVDGAAESVSSEFRIKKGAGSTFHVILSVTDAAGRKDTDSTSVVA